MKIGKVVALVLMACAPALVFAEQSGEVRYTGNELAAQVCKAVVDNDVAKLRMLLRSYRQSVSYGYMFDLDKSGVAQDFSCNNLDLQQFSHRVGAQKVSQYFSKDSATVQPEVAANGN